MGEQRIRKPFNLNPVWDETMASAVDDFLKSVTENQVAIRTGQYTGTGIVQTVAVNELPGPPKMVVIQNPTGTVTGPIIRPLATLKVTAWNQNGFTISADAAVNTAGLVYAYLVLA